MVLPFRRMACWRNVRRSTNRSPAVPAPRGPINVASLGSLVLLLTFVVAAYAAAASVAGARRRNNRLIESGIGAFYTVAALLTVASGLIVYAFVSGDYSI